MHHEIIGFDVRLAAADYLARDWAAARRELFLLDPDVAWPRSVDKTVWPSRFYFLGDYLADGDPTARIEVETTPKDFRESCFLLWADGAAMAARLRDEAPDTAPAGLPVRIEVVTEHPLEPGDPHWGPAFEPRIPPEVPPSPWPLLGYDVADSAMTSGLMNCGFEEPEREPLRTEWAPRLNEHGLFAAPEDAARFRALSDERVPSHAPFFVFALYAG